MALKQINLLEELNAVSKIHTLKRDDIDGIMIEFAQRILCSLHLERLSVWLLNPEKDQLISMGEYDIRYQEFKKEDHAQYFNAIITTKFYSLQTSFLTRVHPNLQLIIPFQMTSFH